VAALLAVAVLGWGACGNDSACPNGTAGSPCQLITEPNERPEIPSAPDLDTLSPDASGADADAGGDGIDNEDSGAAEDGADAAEDADANAAHRRWDRLFASHEAATGNEARGRVSQDMHAASCAVTLARCSVHRPGLERRGAVGTRTYDRETRDGEDEPLSADARIRGPRHTPWTHEPASRRQRIA